MSVGSEAAARPLPRRGRFWVVLILGLALFGLGYALFQIATRPPGKEVVRVAGAPEVQEIFGGIEQEGDRLGPEGAEVSIQVFTDLQCGSCRGEFLGTIPPLVEKFVRPGDVKLLLRHYSIAENTTELGFYGAEAAAQQGYGWQYTYLFFRNQGEAEREGRVTQDFLSSLAAPLGEIDIPEWQEYLETQSGSEGQIKKTLEGYDELGERLGIRTQEATVISGPKGTRTLQDGPSLGEIERTIESLRES
jgi:protein-disulfide isomerase